MALRNDYIGQHRRPANAFGQFGCYILHRHRRDLPPPPPPLSPPTHFFTFLSKPGTTPTYGLDLRTAMFARLLRILYSLEERANFSSTQLLFDRILGMLLVR